MPYNVHPKGAHRRPKPEYALKNLVIVMAGDQSLHEHYARDRDYELWVCYWGNDPKVADRYRQTCDRLVVQKGEKWGLARHLRWIDGAGSGPPFSEYDFIFLPDDDFEFPGGAADISRAFRLAKDIGADSFHPAIANEHYVWEATRQIPECLCHATTIVDLMAPGFSGEMFGSCVLPALHALGHVDVGWGMQPVYVRMGEALFGRPVRSFMLDAIGAIHTRPVGQGSASHARGRDEAYLLPQSDAHLMEELARFSDVVEAARFAFPYLDETAKTETRDRKLARIRDGRLLAYRARRHDVVALILKLILRRERARAHHYS